MSPKELRLSVLQMAAPAIHADTKVSAEALAKGIKFCGRAVDDQSHLLLLPETWNLGFADDGMPASERLAFLQEIAVKSNDDAFIAIHREFARKHRVVLVLGVLRWAHR